VPIVSILVQACLAIALALTGTFDQLTDYVVFSSWIFYAMVTSVVFVLRKKRPHDHRAYKAFGYPVLPLIFIILGVLLLINTILTNPGATMVGLAFILSGIPCYFFFKKRKTLHL
jgi:APA family basic amino acid/polyamine antiporter